MQNRVRSSIFALALLLPVGLAAQGGTAVWSIRGDVPDTVQKVLPGGVSTFDLTLTLASDGQSASFLLAPGPEMIAGMLDVDLSTTRVQVLARKGIDSISVGIVLPPNIAAMMGGGIGFRLDLPIPDSIPLPANFDSLETTDHFTFANTGRTDSVAGLGCEVWTSSSPAQPDNQLEFCLTSDKNPVFHAFKSVVGERYAKWLKTVSERSDAHDNPLQNRDLTPIRIRFMGEGMMTMELISISTDSPPSSFFQLPADLTPLPPELLQAAQAGVGTKGT